MPYATAAAEAAPTRFARKTREGSTIWRTDYFGPPPSPVGSNSVDPTAKPTVDYADPAPGERRAPQAFMVEQEPGAIVHPHFHYVDQFQVAVRGGGTLGRHPVGPVTVHFAGASTGYGPITPGDRGLTYFTLRASADGTGAQFLPASRDRMRAGARRNLMLGPIHPGTDAERAARQANERDIVLTEPDGLEVSVLRLAPGAQATAPDPSRGAGQSMLVIAGRLHAAGKTLDPLSALFVAPDEDALAVTAGAEGADLLILQYPTTSG